MLLKFYSLILSWVVGSIQYCLTRYLKRESESLQVDPGTIEDQGANNITQDDDHENRVQTVDLIKDPVSTLDPEIIEDSGRANANDVVNDRITINRSENTTSGTRVMIVSDSDDVLEEWTVEITVSNDIPDSELPNAYMSFGRYLHGIYASNKISKIIRTLILIFRQVYNNRALTQNTRIYALEWLSELYRENFRWSRNKSHLEKCIHLLREALALRGCEEPEKMSHLRNMAVNMVQPGYMDTHAAEYLDYAVMLYREVEGFLKLHPLPEEIIAEKTSANTRSYTLDELGYCYKSLYEQRRRPEDLDNAIQVIHEHTLLCESCLGSRPVCRHVWGNLAACYIHRYDEAGSQTNDDLEEGARLYRKCLKSWRDREEGDSDNGLWHANLINALTIRFTKFYNKNDLEEARALELEARNIFKPDDPRYRESLYHLGNLLQIRSLLLVGGEEDLDESIEIYERIGRNSRSNLSSSYSTRFSKKGDKSDWYRARDLAQDELNDHSVGNPWRSNALVALAMIYSMKGAPEFDLRKALMYRLESLQDNSTSPSSRLGNTAWIFNNVDINWDTLDTEVHRLFLDVLMATMRLLPLAASFGLAPSSRLTAIEREDEVAIQAASQALRLCDIGLAIEILEEGRAIFWSQALNLRSPFEGVPEPQKGSLIHLTNELENLNLSPSPLSKVDIDARAATMRRLDSQITEKIEEIRTFHGFSRFLLPLRAEEITCVADSGPVVVLLATRHSCDAIVIKGRNEMSRIKLLVETEHLQRAAQLVKDLSLGARDGNDVEIPEKEEFFRQYIQSDIPEINTLRSTSRDQTTSQDVLMFLWKAVVKPVIDELQLRPTSGRNRPRLWWCPTGPFTFLPIHAAREETSSISECCSDYFVSSYTPTLRRLLDSRKALEPIYYSDIRVLLAAVPKPFQGSLLPKATEEAKIIQNAISEARKRKESQGQTMQEFETSIDILREMPHATILHLACHGTQNAEKPLESGFIMKDAVLTMSQLMSLSQKHSFMAFLSACETAKGDKKYPDQVVHLAATMLFVGFKSVIGTMWSMYDQDGPSISDAVYSKILDGSTTLNPDDVAYAVDEAVQMLKDEGAQVERWATYIHIGV